MANDLRGFLADFAIEFEPRLRKAVGDLDHRYTPEFKEAVAYTALAGGKRIRPAVIELWAMVSGKVPAESVLQAGVAIELIHTCSLVLDDLPSMDDASLRRGRPTCHVKFGEDTAILAANAQLMLAFELLADLDERHRGLRSTRSLARAVGASGMIGGQHVDLRYQAQGRDLTALEYIHSHKTGVLFEACAEMGVRLGGGDARLEEHARVYARNLGLAFQIKDDLLDGSSTAEELGKDARQDKGKATFVAMLGATESEEIMHQLLDTARESVQALPQPNSYLVQLCDFVGSRRS